MSKAEDRIAELFGAPLGEFVAQRNALAKALDASGDDDVATTVRAMKKPALAVWAVNQLARQARGEIEALIDASDALRKAQLGAGKADAFREATQAQRKALRALSEQLEGVLTGGGHAASASTVDRATTLLRAASIDPEAQGDLRRGTLVDDVESRGFDELTGALRSSSVRAAPTPAKARKAKKKPAASGESAAEARAREREEREAEKQREREAREAEKAERMREAEAAREAALRERIAGLEAEADEREAEAKEAARALREAQQALARAEREAEQAEARATTAREKAQALRAKLA